MAVKSLAIQYILIIYLLQTNVHYISKQKKSVEFLSKKKKKELVEFKASSD